MIAWQPVQMGSWDRFEPLPCNPELVKQLTKCLCEWKNGDFCFLYVMNYKVIHELFIFETQYDVTSKSRVH